MSQSGARVQVLHCHVVRRAVEVGRELGAKINSDTEGSLGMEEVGRKAAKW